jgi:hypothetical protein
MLLNVTTSEDLRPNAMPQLTLALLVARIGADDVNHAAAADYLAMLADSLHAGSDFHGWLLANSVNAA